MEKNFLNNYILDLLESLNQNLSSYMKVKEYEYLHHLRVDIKKINAILSFAEKIFKTKYNANLLKLLFHDAGKIREIQINLNLLIQPVTQHLCTTNTLYAFVCIHQHLLAIKRGFLLLIYQL